MKYLESDFRYNITTYRHIMLMVDNIYECYLFVTPSENCILKLAVSRSSVYNKFQVASKEMPFDIFEIAKNNTPIIIEDAKKEYYQLVTHTVRNINLLHSSLLSDYVSNKDNELEELARQVSEDKLLSQEYCDNRTEYHINIEWDGNNWCLENNRNPQIIRFNRFSTAESVVKYICRLNNCVINILKTKLK